METKVIALANAKRGVGKSSVCVNLALSLMKKKKSLVHAFDLDPQAAMEGFLLDYERKTPNLQHKAIPQSSVASLSKMLGSLSGKASHVVLDVCGGDTMTIQSILPHTTLMILPSRPSKKDFASTAAFLIALTDKGYFKAYPSLKAYILLNQCSYHPKSTIAQEMVDEYNDLIVEGGLQGRVEVLDSRITVATAWIEADMRCESIVESKTKSAKQWEALLKELTKKGGI